MRAYRFVHLSDIHFGQERDGTLIPHQDVREEAIRDCAAMKERDGPAAGIIVTGDTAFSGKREEYKNAVGWLDRLASAVGCPRTAIYVIPGNHDVDLAAIDYSAKLIQDTLRKASPTEVQAHLEHLAKGSEEAHPLFRKLAAYREFAEQYGRDFESLARPSWEKDLLFGDDNEYTLRLVGLASVQVSEGKLDAKGNMVLGNQQYVLTRCPNVEYVFLTHHPLEWFNDRAAAEEYLHSRARVLMFGHEHLPNIRTLTCADDSQVLYIDAGATNPPEREAGYNYTFNWVEFSLREQDARMRLAVKIYPRAWARSQTQFRADRSRMELGADEGKVFLVNCPMLAVKAKPIGCAASPSGAEVPPAAATAVPAGTEVQGVEPMVPQNEDHFARLRLLFWRHLDWRQRLSVLARLNLLPTALDRPVPQTMERLALNTARAHNQLGALWSLVMEFVPETQREANPFDTTS